MLFPFWEFDIALVECGGVAAAAGLVYIVWLPTWQGKPIEGRGVTPNILVAATRRLGAIWQRLVGPIFSK